MKNTGRIKLLFMDSSQRKSRENEHLIRDVETYEKAPTHVEHERLLVRIQHFYREPNVADFFDQEGCLPLVNAAPYPMKQHEAFRFQLWLTGTWILVSFGLCAASKFWFSDNTWLIAAAVISAALVFIFPIVADAIWSRRLPDDIQERLRLVNVFEELRRTEVWRSERRAKEEAANRRVSRAAQARRKFKRTHERVTPASILLRRRDTTK
ncbi:hypothetical protein QBL02_03855 [Leucobacter sp. UT-8R-CII-1-4]|uniref:hypothetical protein n=1 Tax=Leucobacter sp. UT-8R-CII-1-4 TaxID=3040075 RepID=UPI0024AA024E|nr:hypothetical protein [Leucobacter sp. UT-8R-CII-1-4]MDI6022675.1 hypothetical protein [Leucobacter sp. UT-8R-CII-1-4]